MAWEQGNPTEKRKQATKRERENTQKNISKAIDRSNKILQIRHSVGITSKPSISTRQNNQYFLKKWCKITVYRHWNNNNYNVKYKQSIDL